MKTCIGISNIIDQCIIVSITQFKIYSNYLYFLVKLQPTLHIFHCKSRDFLHKHSNHFFAGIVTLLVFLKKFDSEDGTKTNCHLTFIILLININYIFHEYNNLSYLFIHVAKHKFHPITFSTNTSLMRLGCYSDDDGEWRIASGTKHNKNCIIVTRLIC